MTDDEVLMECHKLFKLLTEHIQNECKDENCCVRKVAEKAHF